ncbi:hypothetical protein KR074_010208, partial [Drosophila pseudoananassae]
GHCSPRRTLANLWTRLRSPRPNRATGGYLLTGTSAPRDDELVAGRRRLQEQQQQHLEQDKEQHLARRGYAAADECLINVTDFSDIQISEGAGEVATTTITELRVPTITTTNINSTNNHNNNSNHNNSSSNTNNNNNNNNNMSRIIQPRYRFRDLLLGDFSFNDDGER